MFGTSGRVGIAAAMAMFGFSGFDIPITPRMQDWRNDRRVSYSGARSRGGKRYPAGLNGKRAVARRLRQIEAGSLQVGAGK